MTALSEPVRWDRTVYRGTDHAWPVRRVNQSGDPIIPTSAKAQIRSTYGGALWVECAVAIDSVDGWVTITIPELATAGSEWDNRTRGVWDLEVVVDSKRLRWVHGTITVSQDVTRS